MSSLRMRVQKRIFRLLGVQLDDQLLLDRRRDLRALGIAQDLGGQRVVIGLQPGRNGRDQLGRPTDRVGGGRAQLDRDHVLGTYLVGGDVDAAPVDQPVSVADQLTRLAPRGGEAEAHEDVVEARLEQAQQVLAGDALLAGGLVVVGAELLLQHLVVAARLLLLAQLQPVLGLAHTTAAMLARRVGATLDPALVGEATLALEEELLPLATALLALRSGIAGHQTRLRFFGRQPLWAWGETSLTVVTSRPAACSERIAVSRPDPAPLAKTSTFSSPCSMPFLAAASAVT